MASTCLSKSFLSSYGNQDNSLLLLAVQAANNHCCVAENEKRLSQGLLSRWRNHTSTILHDGFLSFLTQESHEVIRGTRNIMQGLVPILGAKLSG